MTEVKISRDDLNAAVSAAVQARTGERLNKWCQIIPTLHLDACAASGKMVVTGCTIDTPRVWVSSKVPVEMAADSPRLEVTVPVETMVALLKAVPKGTEITLRRDSEKILTMESVIFPGGREVVIMDESYDKCFDIPLAQEGKAEVSVNAKTFTGRAAAVLPAVSTDQCRELLTGVLLRCFNEGEDRLLMVTTDTHRLAVTHMPTYREAMPHLVAEQRIAPAGAMKAAVKLFAKSKGDLEVTVSEQVISVTDGKVKIDAVPIDGEYPNFERVIPSRIERTLVIDSKTLLETLDRCRLVSGDNGKASTSYGKSEYRAQFNLGETPTVRMGDYTEPLPCRIEGSQEEFALALSVGYLKDAVRPYQGDIRIEITDRWISPVIVRDAQKLGHSTVMMPMAIDK